MSENTYRLILNENELHTLLRLLDDVPRGAEVYDDERDELVEHLKHLICELLVEGPGEEEKLFVDDDD